MRDVVVVGAGPAGWAAAAALRKEGVDVTLVAPAPETPFRNGYGMWVDDVADIDFADIFSRVWPAARVVLSNQNSRRLERAYGRVDNAALLNRLVERSAGLHVVKAQVRTVEMDTEDGFEVHLEREATLGEGETLRGRVVIDASGHESGLIVHQPGPKPGWQVALGRRLKLRDPHPFRGDEAVLMDFRPAEDSESAHARPSFLYALPEDPTTVFVEETSLVARPPEAIDALDARLDARLQRLGIRPRDILEVERCFIPMGGPAAPLPQPVVAFGGAARMVHPASGYLLARVLRTAPRLASAVRESLQSGEPRAARSARAWAAVWPRPERASHELYRFGAEVLMMLDTRSTAAFFSAFFSLPETHWRTYLSGTATPPQVRAAMRRVFALSGWGLRWQLIRAGLGPEGAAFRNTLFARG